MIAVNYVDMWKGFDKNNNIFLDAIKKYTDENVVVSDKPDFLFFSCMGTEHQKYGNCIKIFFTGEAVVPNFNECDYAIAYDNIDFQGRYLKRPYFLDSGYPSTCELSDDELLSRKFCNFVYSNETKGTAVEFRKKFAKKLMEYKHIDCPGKVLNNMDGGITPRKGDWYQGKIDFVKNYKFTIAFENCRVPGYTTEKMEHPLLAHSVPIYWGNPEADKYFNPEAFIFVNGYENDLDAVIGKIVHLDKNDEDYLKMVKSSPLSDKKQNSVDDFERFIGNIILNKKSFELDPLGFNNIMCIPRLSGKELVNELQQRVYKIISIK